MSAPFTPLALDHVVLRVRDLDAMTRFYREGLGCEVVHRQDAIGLVHLAAGGSLIDLLQIGGRLDRGGRAAGEGGRNVDHLCLRISPFDELALRGHLAAFGIEAGPVATRYGADGEAPSMSFEDPEGNGLELRAPAPANG